MRKQQQEKRKYSIQEFSLKKIPNQFTGCSIGVVK